MNQEEEHTYTVIHWTAQCLSCGNHGSYCIIEVKFLTEWFSACMCPDCIKKTDKEAVFIDE